ncbi:MAG: hypothetical protein V3T83_08930 [Acidobacteriota bacterium]
MIKRGKEVKIVTIPKKGELLALNVMMNLIEFAGWSNKRFFELKRLATM